MTETLGPDNEHVLSSYGLCTERDSFVKNKCIWIVELKDGSKVFQDDDRPGYAVASAWKRLGHYVHNNPQNSIAKMRLRFRTHIVDLPSHQSLYFYSKGLIQAFTQTYGLDFHVVGWKDDTGDILATWYKAPELVVTETSYRTISSCQPEQIISSEGA